MKRQNKYSRVLALIFIASPIFIGAMFILCSVGMTILGINVLGLNPVSLLIGKTETSSPTTSTMSTNLTILQNNSRLELMWVKSNLSDISENFFDIAASDEVFFLITRKGQSVFREVTALDAHDGSTLLWHDDGPGSGGPTVLHATKDALYIGGQGNVTKLNSKTGEKRWSTSFPLQRGIQYIFSHDSLVYVKGSSDLFLLDAATGKQINNPGSYPQFQSQYFLNRILTPDIEFDLGPGLVGATDRNTGQTLWKKSVLSNALVVETSVYVVDSEDELRLLALSLEDGQVISSVVFTPNLSENQSLLPTQIAFDETQKIIYVFFDHTRQLFAFKLLE